MNKLKDFMNILTGSFNNSEQFDKMKLDNIDFPYAEHVNTICNDKIINFTYFYLHKKKMELN